MLTVAAVIFVSRQTVVPRQAVVFDHEIFIAIGHPRAKYALYLTTEVGLKLVSLACFP